MTPSDSPGVRVRQGVSALPGPGHPAKGVGAPTPPPHNVRNTMTESIRNTILNSMNETEREYVTDNYNSVLGNMVSALEKRESLAVANALSAVEARHGSDYSDEGMRILDREGLNVSGWVAGVEKTQEPAFLAAGDDQPPLVTAPHAEVDGGIDDSILEQVKQYTEEDAEAHIGDDQSDGAEPATAQSEPQETPVIINITLVSGHKKQNKDMAKRVQKILQSL